MYHGEPCPDIGPGANADSQMASSGPFPRLVAQRELSLLSLMDAFLTRQHLVAGTAKELNPFMDMLIQKDPVLWATATEGAVYTFAGF